MTSLPDPFATSGAEALENAIVSVDQSGLLSRTDAQKELHGGVHSQMTAPPDVPYMGDARPHCERLAAGMFRARAVAAMVLGVDSFHLVRHVPKRCQSRLCAFRGLPLWANFVAEKKVHRWVLPRPELSDFFFHSCSDGVNEMRHRGQR